MEIVGAFCESGHIVEEGSKWLYTIYSFCVIGMVMRIDLC